MLYPSPQNIDDLDLEELVLLQPVCDRPAGTQSAQYGTDALHGARHAHHNTSQERLHRKDRREV